MRGLSPPCNATASRACSHSTARTSRTLLSPLSFRSRCNSRRDQRIEGFNAAIAARAADDDAVLVSADADDMARIPPDQVRKLDGAAAGVATACTASPGRVAADCTRHWHTKLHDRRADGTGSNAVGVRGRCRPCRACGALRVRGSRRLTPPGHYISLRRS